MSTTQDLSRWHLSPRAEAGLRWTLSRWPWLTVTSGRRTLAQQITAMATNVSRYGRLWIARTYRPTPLIESMTQWLLAQPEGELTPEAIRSGLMGLAEQAPDQHWMRLSRHLSGDAWDLAWPGEKLGVSIAETIRLEMPKPYQLDRVLTNEGGLRLLHVQFVPAEPPASVMI